VGPAVGDRVGPAVGDRVGPAVGDRVGPGVRTSEGDADGVFEGLRLGTALFVGAAEGSDDG
jgi:hypothetical protein